ncbi:MULTISPECIES: VOC family protein [Deinococcus]|uniref:VOC family protein n=1 Tax=Deinococcus rufus TaxID=2136097 RepID=A0ABV7Z3Y9_9DEIO|nr:VOC family protein [Deinococcus sp. AB2017081]WQE95939.1 VOC family protein [Deinococcus sp. AB2017081]
MTGLQFSMHHFGLSVADLDATIAWYTDTLDFELESAYDIPALSARAAFLRHGSVWVELFEVSGAVPAPENAQDLRVHGLRHVALAVDDIGATRDLLRTRGVEFVSEPATVPGSGGDRYAFFRDNNGILIELYEMHRA